MAESLTTSQKSRPARPLAQPLSSDSKKYLEYLHDPRNSSPPPLAPITKPLNTTTMPKSKRAKVVHLTKVDKKGKELTLKLFSNVRGCLDQYQYCFVFSVENMRNTYLKDVRSEFSDSRSVSYFKRRLEREVV